MAYTIESNGGKLTCACHSRRSFLACRAYNERETGEAYAKKAADEQWLYALLLAAGKSGAGIGRNRAGRAGRRTALSVHSWMGMGGAAGLCADLRGAGAASPGKSGEVT